MERSGDNSCDVLVLGAGLAGLSAASALGDRACVLEQASRPGGLVKTEFRNGYWFDHVLHMLYFADEKTRSRISALLERDLTPCEAEAWVETPEGTTRFPFQMHLRGLQPEAAIRCVADLACATYQSRTELPANFEQALLSTFGRSMCEVFLFPYNKKVWKRPLSSLAPSGIWTITAPNFEQVLRGAILDIPRFRAYNADGWYPTPTWAAPLRGMELLTQALASHTRNLKVRYTVQSIDLETHTLLAAAPCGVERFHYNTLCSTIPLPRLISLCDGVPQHLTRNCATLLRNRVISVFVSGAGPRQRRGHWRYYSDPELIFTRIAFMHEFDPYMAPSNGWGLLVEITERAEDPAIKESDLLPRVASDLHRVGVLTNGAITDMALLRIDPAYVVFTPETTRIVSEAMEFLREHDVHCVGRYARWEYSSMAGVMRDGWDWAEAL